MLVQLKSKLADLYENYQYIYPELNESHRLKFDRILASTVTNEDITFSLRNLSQYLRKYHGQKCIILVDEYDHPLDIAHQNNYIKEAHEFFRDMLESLLKVCNLIETRLFNKHGNLKFCCY